MLLLSRLKSWPACANHSIFADVQWSPVFGSQDAEFVMEQVQIDFRMQVRHSSASTCSPAFRRLWWVQRCCACCVPTLTMLVFASRWWCYLTKPKVCHSRHRLSQQPEAVCLSLTCMHVHALIVDAGPDTHAYLFSQSACLTLHPRMPCSQTCCHGIKALATSQESCCLVTCCLVRSSQGSEIYIISVPQV